MSKTRLSAPEGFSLIELLVVVAVVGILAAVAYPSYQEQLASARRSDMKAELMRLAQYMERLYTETGSQRQRQHRRHEGQRHQGENSSPNSTMAPRPR
jgi:prepilin-type N-terminal cleavage/methylation domain-containing protein